MDKGRAIPVVDSGLAASTADELQQLRQWWQAQGCLVRMAPTGRAVRVVVTWTPPIGLSPTGGVLLYDSGRAIWSPDGRFAEEAARLVVERAFTHWTGSFRFNGRWRAEEADRLWRHARRAYVEILNYETPTPAALAAWQAEEDMRSSVLAAAAGGRAMVAYVAGRSGAGTPPELRAMANGLTQAARDDIERMSPTDLAVAVPGWSAFGREILAADPTAGVSRIGDDDAPPPEGAATPLPGGLR